MTATDILSRLGVDEEAIADFCRRRKVRELAVFGSAARGDMRVDSDVDAMVEFEAGVEWGLLDLGGMQQDLVRIFGRNVDLVTKGPIRNPFKRASIMRDLIVVYAA